MNYPQQTEQINELQDTVVTLRQDIPKLYKGLLMKECQIVANNLAEAKFNIPHQNMEALRDIRSVDLDETRLRGNSIRMREILNRAQQLHQCMRNARNK